MSGPASQEITLAALLALAVVACGGGDPTPRPSGSASTPESPTATVAASAGPAAGSAAPTPSAPTASASTAASMPAATATLTTIPAFDLAALTEGLEGVDSYRTSFMIDGAERYSSIVVTTPDPRRQITFVDGGAATTVIAIGDQRWVRSGEEPLFVPVPAELAAAMLDAFDPTAVVGTYASADWRDRATDLGAEDKNGVPAHHYRIDAASSAGAAVPLAPGAAIDVWIADAGYLVAWESTGVADAATVSIQVTGIDDPANVVREPN